MPVPVLVDFRAETLLDAYNFDQYSARGDNTNGHVAFLAQSRPHVTIYTYSPKVTKSEHLGNSVQK